MSKKTDSKSGRYSKAQRVDKEKVSWYVEMEENFANHGIKREDYHRRKFSGRPLNVLMANATSIFNSAKRILRKHCDPTKMKTLLMNCANR